MAQAEARHYVNAAHDSEFKRKKTTMEKAKANYLFSQLRIRLQYAKLKVDHGWQKQTLNEVENLYFRHSQTNRQHFNTINAESTSSQQTEVSTQSSAPISTPHSLSDGSSASLIRGSTGVISGQDASLPPAATNHSPQTSVDQVSSVSPPYTADAPNPHQSPRRAASAKGKERDHSLPSPLFNGPPSTPTRLLSPSKRTNRNAKSQNIVEDFPPATLADGGIQSSAKYLSSTYISSSPFPINVPMPGQDLPVPPSPFGARDQALTYDSFWSSHSTWSSHLSLGGTGSPTRATTQTAQVATTPAGSLQP